MPTVSDLKARIQLEESAQKDRRRARWEVEADERCAADHTRRSYRPSLRALYLAYAMLREVPYKSVEYHTNTPPDADAVSAETGVNADALASWLSEPGPASLRTKESAPCTASGSL